MAKYQAKMKEIHREDPDKNVSQTDEQTDRWTDKQDWLYRTPSAQMEVYVFQKFKNKSFLNSRIQLDFEPYGKNKYKKKEHNQHSSMNKEFKNNDPWQIFIKITFILLECHRSIDKSIDFNFFLLS